MRKNDIETSEKILDLWKMQEYFTPLSYPKLTFRLEKDGKVYYLDRFYDNASNNDIITTKDYKEYNEKISDINHKYKYIRIYYGCYKINTFLLKMAEVLKLNENELNEINEISGDFYIYSMQLNLDGKISDSSFKINPFFYAVYKIIYDARITDIEVDDITNLEKNINEILLREQDEEFNNFYKLQKIKEILSEKLNIKLEKFEEKLGLESISSNIYCCKGIKSDDQDNFSSFYLHDIELIKNNLSKNDNIIKYIKSLLNDNKKIMIDSNVDEMKKWLDVDKFPFAKYPSKFSPTLMQQIAINIATSENHEYTGNIFSVNGPPGTGKTTLLKEVIASNVEKMAEELIKIHESNLWEKFKRSKNIKSTSTPNYKDFYYTIPDEISKYGMLVVSNNNGAVENITLDLPKGESLYKDKTHTNLFDILDNDEVYFSEVADEISNSNKKKSSWGLISARMGRKVYITTLLEKCRFSKRNEDKKANVYLNSHEEDCIDFKVAINNFKEAKREVLRLREKIKEDIKNSEKFEKELAERESLEKGLSELYEEKENANIKIEELIKEIDELNNTIIENKEKINTVKSGLSIVDKILVSIGMGKGSELIKSFSNKIMDDLIKINEKENKLNELKDSIIKCDKRIKDNKIRLESLEKISKQLEDIKEKYGNNYVNETFFHNITSNENSQNACPWTYSEYDKSREMLFFHALQLRKSFILNKPYVKRNLNVYQNYSNLNTEEKKEIYPHLLNSLSIVIPVLSSTFASIERFLEFVDSKQLGMLIIDEAGQANPYSALGAIYRTKKVVVVGDPLQVEPVITIPRILVDIFAKQLGVDEKYNDINNSVQVLADKINKFNGDLGNEELGPRIVGCPLVVHRRCIDPMFSISNMISYNGRMFNKTANKNQDFLLNKSCWIDVDGEEEGNKNHFVEKQANIVYKLLNKAYNDDNNIFSKYNRIFIISPFKSVSNGMKEYIKRKFNNIEDKILKNWVNNCIGTVHTFQGKDAEEVLFVLGCSSKSEGAMNWVVSKANIINVACTRAKYRIAFIGKFDDWKNRRYFDIKTIKKMKILTEEEVDKEFI